MNARQKAKFYKRKYEELLHMPIPKTIVETRNVDTLRYEKFISEDFIFDNVKNSGIFRIVLGEMEDSLREELRRHYEWHLEHIPEKSMFKFTAQIKLIDPGVQEELECILTK